MWQIGIFILIVVVVVAVFISVRALVPVQHSYRAGYDYHNHPLLWGLFESGVSIKNAASKSDAINMMANHIKSSTEDTEDIVIVTDWINSVFELTLDDLSRFGHLPLIVFNASCHGALINGAAAYVLGLQAGMLGEEEIKELIKKLVANKERVKRGLLQQQQKLFSLGIVGADEMFVQTIAQLQAVKELRESGDLKMRLRIFVVDELLPALKERTDLCDLIYGVKFFSDGALGVRTAAVFEPYEDTGGNGELLETAESLSEKIRQALEIIPRLVVATHAIGDRAIKEVIQAYLLCQDHFNITGWRIEHAELLSPDQAGRAKMMGIVLSVQPNFIEDAEMYGDRLGERTKFINPFGMLVDYGFVAGDNLLLGSDGMPTGWQYGLWCAAGKEDLSPIQRLTWSQAVAAYASPYSGDQVILSGPIEDPNSVVLETWIGNDLVYQRE